MKNFAIQLGYTLLFGGIAAGVILGAIWLGTVAIPTVW